MVWVVSNGVHNIYIHKIRTPLIHQKMFPVEMIPFEASAFPETPNIPNYHIKLIILISIYTCICTYRASKYPPQWMKVLNFHENLG